MHNIKIVYVIDSLGKGGAERQLFELIKGLHETRFKPLVISLSEGGYWIKEFERIAVKLIELQYRKHFELARLMELTKILIKERPQILHSFMFAGNAYGRIAAKLAGVPVIIASERSQENRKGRFTAMTDRLLAKMTDCVISNSKVNRDYLVEKSILPMEKSIVVHNGIDSSKYQYFGNNTNLRNKLGIGIDDYVIGTVASLRDCKNQRMLFEAIKLIIVKNRFVKLLLVGEGPLQIALQQYTEKLNIAKNVIFVGMRNDIPDLLGLMNVFVLTSKFEGLSNAIMEAMAAGVPCVVTDVGGNKELVIDGKTGFLIPLNDYIMLAEKIIFFMNHPNYTRKMGTKGREFISKEFSVNKMVYNMENVYETLLKKKCLDSKS